MQEKEEEGRKRGGGRGEKGKCLTFIKGTISSLSALVNTCYGQWIINRQCSHKTMYALRRIWSLKIMYFCNFTPARSQQECYNVKSSRL